MKPLIQTLLLILTATLCYKLANALTLFDPLGILFLAVSVVSIVFAFNTVLQAINHVPN